MEEREERYMAENHERGRALQAAQERLATIYNEQASLSQLSILILAPLHFLQRLCPIDVARLTRSRLETDVQERDELLDRVRSRMGMIERDLRESQNRATNQV